jgi:hypothetical protein
MIGAQVYSSEREVGVLEAMEKPIRDGERSSRIRRFK